MSTSSAMYALQCMCCAIHALLFDQSSQMIARAAQTLRGGRVKLQTIMVPETEYTHHDKVCSWEYIRLTSSQESPQECLSRLLVPSPNKCLQDCRDFWTSAGVSITSAILIQVASL